MWRIGNSVARVFSVLLQPLLMPLYSIALLFVYTNFYAMYMGQLFRFLLPVFVFTFMMPSMFVFILWKFRYIRDFNLSEQYERIFPYVVFITANLSLTYFFYAAGVYLWFIGLVIAPAIIAIVGFIINFFWKISAHMLGIGGVIGGVLSVCFNVKGTNPFILFIVLFLLAGCLGVSRLLLRKSTPAQVYVGFIVGFVLAYASVFVGVYSLLLSLK